MGEQTVDRASGRKLTDQAPDGAGCEAFRLQVATVGRRLDEAAAFLRGSTAHGLARLTFEWGVLEARLERITFAFPTREGCLELWTSPPLEQLRARMRRLLQLGVACSRAPGAASRLVSQLFQLASMLSAHEATLRGLRGLPELVAQTNTITAYLVGHAS